MKRRDVVLVSMALAAPVLTASAADDLQAARDAANRWLGMADRSEAGSSWQQAATMFKRAVTAEQWAQALSAVRGPLGALTQRTERGAQRANSLPGAPDGQYVLLEFQTSFAHKASAVETVTVVLDTDGAWHVTGYFIR